MKMEKKVIITLSKKFPKKHSKSGQPTDFAEKLANTLHDKDGWRKLHTIRHNFDMWQHNIEKINAGRFFLSVRQWSAAPYRSKQEEIERIKKLGYQRISLRYDKDTDTITALIDGTKKLEDFGILNLAHNDGLSPEDFKEWFFGDCSESKTFNGIIIHFTDFRY